jgi:IS605 OrfB family transposase
MVKTRKIEIIPNGDKKTIISKLTEITEACTTLSNEISRAAIMNFDNLRKLKEENPDLSSEEINKMVTNQLGMSMRNVGYDISKKYSSTIPSNIRTTLNSNIFKTINKLKNDIFKNKISVPSFTKSNTPIYFNWKNSITKKEDKYYFNLNGELSFTIHFGRDRSNNKVIVDRILSGQYKGCDSNVSVKDNKIFLNLSFSFTPEKNETVDPNLCLGIDMGINRPISIARSDDKYISQIELGESIVGARLQFQKRRRELSRGLKFANGGRGRNEKMKKLDSIRNKEHNYIETINHKLSKSVIDICKKENIGKIRMEDLTGITKESNEYFLKSWSYYQIESMIKYKAEESGIQIEYVKSKDTSKMCHCCGVIQNNARSKEDVTKFICQTVDCNLFGKTQDADINAAKNISKKDGFKEKPNSKKGRIENWKKKQKENLTV